MHGQLRHVWSCVPRLPNLKLSYNRFKLSHIATAYFALALLHCITQVVLQLRGLEIEHAESVHLRHIMHVGESTYKFAILDSSNAILICHAIPGRTSDTRPCETFPVDPSGLASTSLNATVDTCGQVLSWPAQMVHQAIRESIAMMVFQTWLVGISIVAIITESIPHVVAGLVTQLLSTAWSWFHIASTERLHRIYNTLVVDLACNDVDPMPNYWESKMNNQIPILALNAVSLLVCVLLSCKLCKQFGVQSFTRVGGSTRIHHLYLLVLVLSVFLQLTTFFLFTSLVLWIEQLFNGTIAVLDDKHTVYLWGFILTAVLIVPWLYMGWTAVRRERRRMMVFFLSTSIALTMSQMNMFNSSIYRLTFSTWNFFGSITVIAYILLNMSFFMALVCRYFFGRGLAHFLQVQKALGECDFTPVYIERGSPMFESASTKEGATMPWDVEGRSVVKKLSLPRLDQHRDGDQISIPSAAFVGSSASRASSFSVSSHATDPRDFSTVLDTAAVLNQGRGSISQKSTATIHEPGVPAPVQLSHRSSACSKSTIRLEYLGDSITQENDTNRSGTPTHSIHRGIGFSPATTSTSVQQPLVSLPSSVKQKLKCSANLTIIIPRESDL